MSRQIDIMTAISHRCAFDKSGNISLRVGKRSVEEEAPRRRRVCSQGKSAAKYRLKDCQYPSPFPPAASSLSTTLLLSFSFSYENVTSSGDRKRETRQRSERSGFLAFFFPSCHPFPSARRPLALSFWSSYVVLSLLSRLIIRPSFRVITRADCK